MTSLNSYQEIPKFQEVQDREASSCKASESTLKTIKRRKRKNTLPDISKNIAQVIHLIETRAIEIIEGRYNNSKQGKKNVKRRSSDYIGVSKNGLHWQVLINYGKTKKYIGTYTCEKEAAIAYDFYSILLNTFKAKTNFSYTPDQIIEMIQSYKRGTS